MIVQRQLNIAAFDGVVIDLLLLFLLMQTNELLEKFRWLEKIIRRKNPFLCGQF